MKKLNRSPLPFLLLFLPALLAAQYENHTFQWLYKYSEGGDFRVSDAVPTADHGYVLAGLLEVADGTGLMFPCAYRVDCQGTVVWTVVFDQAGEGANNTGTRILKRSENDFILVSNVGFYFSTPHQDPFVARIDGTGEVLWAHRFGGGQNEIDVANAATLTSDGGIVLAGSSASFGTDAGSVSYSDQYFLKIDADGKIVWSRTYGNKQAVDRSFSIVETADQSLVAAGSYLHTGSTFHANLLKMNKDGELVWNRTYGDGGPPHGNHAYGLTAASDGGFLITGSTTNAGTNFQDYPDFLVIKTDAEGTPEWTRVFAGGNSNLFENAVNSYQKPNGDFVVMGATASYPTSGFVPNKYVLLNVSPNGQLTAARSLNGGGSHFPRIIADPDENSVLVTGFTNWDGYGGDNNTFQPILINLDKNYTIFNCHSSNYTALTTTFTPPFVFDSAPATKGTGGTIVSNLFFASVFDLELSKVCETNGFSDCSQFTAAPEPAENQSVSIAPNPAPAGSKITFRWASPDLEKISIHDAQGRLVVENQSFTGLKTLDLRLPEGGVYFVSFYFPEGRRVEKLVVR